MQKNVAPNLDRSNTFTGYGTVHGSLSMSSIPLSSIPIELAKLRVIPPMADL